MSDLDALDAPTRTLLDRFGFDRRTFEELRRRLADFGLARFENTVKGRVERPERADVSALDARRAVWAEAGRAAVAEGRLGVVVLAGGMATRWGGVVKAGVEVTDGRSFLDLKVATVREVARRSGGRIPIFLMTSFATDDEVRALAARLDSAEAPITTFSQFVSLRLDLQGGLFRGADGATSPYAPGHGDLTFALRASGLLGRFRASGGRLLCISNVDNLGASPDPAVVGAHLALGRPLTVEVTDKEPGEKGGAPARVDGVLQILETFRFPPAFPQDSIDVFNTNTFVMDAAAIDLDFPLTWFAVTKTVDGRSAVQFERLVGEVSAFLPATYLRVPRTGSEGRFLPVKDPDELARRMPDIRAALAARGAL